MRKRFFIASLAITLVILSLGISFVVLAASQGVEAISVAQSGTTTTELKINEVAPVANNGKPAWVELTVEAQQRFLPFVSNQASTSQAAQPAPVDVSLAVSQADSANTYVLDLNGSIYQLPAGLPEIAPGEFVVVVLGQSGQDDLDFNDNVATLYASSVPGDALSGDGGYVGLYNSTVLTPTNMLDYVAWGDIPASADDQAVAAGLWDENATLVFNPGYGGEYSELVPEFPDESFGRFADVWAPYRSTNSSKGRPNPVPAPIYSEYEHGMALESDAFGVDWAPVPGANAYEFQLAQDEAFQNILLTLVTPNNGWAPDPPLPPGTFYWRVRTVALDGARSVFFGPFQATNMPVLSIIQEKTLMTQDQYHVQRKDTTMLDVGGGKGNENGNGSPRYGYPNRWDGPHVFGEALQLPSYSENGYDNVFCVRAAIAMLVDYYGGSLSEDRISYHMKEEIIDNSNPTKGIPEGDLGFGRVASVMPTLSWALNLNDSDIVKVEYCPDPRANAADEDYTCSTDALNVAAKKLSFTEVQNLIDHGQVFIDGKPGHVRVIDGYAILADGTKMVEVFNPKPLSSICTPQQCVGVYWADFDSVAENHITSYYVANGVTPHPRSDEPSLWQDSDGDGVNNFDELVRFHTDPYNPDTDGDWVNDKEDIAGYVFDWTNQYSKQPADLGLTLIAPNTYGVELDKLRKEVDWDNDDDGIPDGCEDANLDGVYGISQPFPAPPHSQFDSGNESSNFSPLDHIPCVPGAIYIVNPSWGTPQDVGPYNNPDPLQINLLALLPEPMTNKPLYDASNFKVLIGGQPANILAVNRSGAYHLLVQPPNQPSAGKYDLQVTWSDPQLPSKWTAQDTEETAVLYESPPLQNPTPLNRSVVLALDSSSLMSSIDSRQALENAARLFADQWGAQDRIGLVTFGQGSPNVAVPLAQVGASGTPIAAVKTAIDGLPGSGESALGSGLELAQQQLDSLAGTDDSLNIAVFSAGQPSVEPYPDELFSQQSGSLSAFTSLPPDDSCQCAGDVFSATHIHSLGLGEVQANFFSGLERLSDATHGGLGVLSSPLQNSPYMPDMLANRLASDFQYAAARMRGEQRLLEAFGSTTGLNLDTYKVHLDSSNSIAFMANFGEANFGAFSVLRPDGSQVQPGDSGVLYRSDPTHQYYRISNPDSGDWQVQVRSSLGPDQTEYLVIASAKTATKLFANDPVYRGGAAFVFHPQLNKPLSLGVVLADNAPISNAAVKATILRPDGSLVDQFQLSDDGMHEDGFANDGAYGAVFTPTLPGGYVVKYLASGSDHAGQEFTRYAQSDFSIPRAAAYVYTVDDAPQTFTGYQGLLSESSIPMVGVPSSAISTTDWSQFSLILIAPDSAGPGEHWLSDAERTLISKSGLPILGLNYGGYDLFADYGLNIGTNALIKKSLLNTTPANASDPIWDMPFPLPTALSYNLYTDTSGLSLNLDPVPTSVTQIGREPGTLHLNIALEQRRYLLWGFEQGPGNMTTNGRRLFSNLVALLLR